MNIFLVSSFWREITRKKYDKEVLHNGLYRIDDKFTTNKPRKHKKYTNTSPWLTDNVKKFLPGFKIYKKTLNVKLFPAFVIHKNPICRHA